MNELRQIIETLPGVALVLIGAFIMLNAIMWFFLPFAVFGIKKRMNKSAQTQEAILKIMRGAE